MPDKIEVMRDTPVESESLSASENAARPARRAHKLILRSSRQAGRSNSEQQLAVSAACDDQSQSDHIPAPRQGSLNMDKYSMRLLGVAEARALNQEPNAAGRLYRELIAPYEPAPALLALHLQGIARIELELQSWERIRDARLEHRAQQNALEMRRRYRDMDRELRATAAQVLESGLHRLPDSPGKFKKQIECLEVLKAQLQRREFSSIRPALRQLYGNKLDPDYERAQLICIDCRRLMDRGDAPLLKEEEFETLLGFIEEELNDAVEGYNLQLDERTMTASECLSSLASRDDQWMEQRGDRLRQTLDRAKAMTPKILAMLGLVPNSSRSSGRHSITDSTADEPAAAQPEPSSRARKGRVSPLRSTREARRTR